ncbi:bacillithiol biosynthesis cysteine-adding enzyme BshC [Desertivirga brevis]|uniref:bacillithiol biosynthesis cysteine-adding enzyme BshC n=1 Tax=Desertivirga brevis TaxID=2810310 RepID=UPI001A956CF4|nr:bacillithiol biosynthesis cysteine-adding enzyme BshC [Pedobacter sp. SYSU D00873]
MKATYINYSDTKSFSPTILSYLAHDPNLNPFISYFPTLDNFGKLLHERKVGADRTILVETLLNQYSRLKTTLSAAVQKNIELLRDEKTFTVTTGHQLNIFTGPLYFIYKIVTAINLAKELKLAYPDKDFVPVYWMASEDHDFAEINHTSLLGRKISWDSEVSGATGKVDPSTIREALREYQQVLGVSDNSAKLSAIIEQAYLHHNTLADATRYLVNALFESYGLLVVDADEKLLKQQFASIMEEDIINQRSFSLINQTSSNLAQAGFNTQVNAREINFFYMIEGVRERIVFENGKYYVLNTELKFSKEELQQEIKAYPERFSPNVIMRPLYQEVILPNLAYIGGGAEIVYWLQLKSNFDFYKIDFPILLLRNSALITHEEFTNKLCRLQICHKDIFRPAEELKKEWVINHSNHTLNLSAEWVELNSIFEKIKLRTYKIDPTLSPSTEAVKVRLQKAINNLEKKMIKADVRNHDEILEKIDSLRSKYFPGNGLQERIENFACFYIKHGDGFIEELVRHFKPLDFKFTILEP